MSRRTYWPGLAYFLGLAVACTGFPVGAAVMAAQTGAWFLWLVAAMLGFLSVAMWGITIGVVQQEIAEASSAPEGGSP